MDRNHLSQVQTNELFRRIKRARLDPASFRWSECPAAFAGWIDSTCPCIEHVTANARVSFAHVPREWAIRGGGRIRRRGGEHWVQYAPGKEIATEVKDQLTWDEVLEVFDAWLTRIHGLCTEPDLWSTDEATRAAIINLSSAADPEAKFTASEQQMLAARLDEVVEEIRHARGLTGAELANLQGDVDEIREDLAKLTKRQWVRTVLGWIVSLGFEFSLSTETVGNLIGKIGSSIKGLVSG